MKKAVIGICVVVMMLLTRLSYGEETGQSEIEMLRRMVEEQNRTINQLLHRIEALESDHERVEVKQEEYGEWMEAKKSEKPLWSERVRVKGDLRYRYEHVRNDRRSPDRDDNRNRNRVRARIGVDAELLPTLDLHLQLSTAEVVDANGKDEGDPVSGNQTLTNAWSLKNVWLSQAWADWHPEAAPGLSILAGKIKRPFITPVSSELVWDGDVNPEGAMIDYHREFDRFELFVKGYGFWTIERKTEGDSGLFGAQGALKHNFTAFDDKAHVMGGLSYYDYGDTDGEEFFVDGDPFGNSTDPTETFFAEDFDLFEVFGEVGFRVRNVPVVVFADYVTNTAADDDDQGWSVGFQVARSPWKFRYLYKEVEKDAVFGAFTDSDFGGGGTNAEGHELNLSYKLTKNWELAATYFHNDTGIASGDDEEDYQRLQLDAKFKF